MHEFNNRIDAQRQALMAVNRKWRLAEPLFSLSKKSIERWLIVNRLDPGWEVAKILFEMSSKLFFLASKSQEQVSEKYQFLSKEIRVLQERLEAIES